MERKQQQKKLGFNITYVKNKLASGIHSFVWYNDVVVYLR